MTSVALNPNSALFWYPRVAGHVPVPMSVFIPIDYWSLVPMLDGEPPSQELMQQIKDTAEGMGYPCFFRTDLASAKHDGPPGYRLDHPDQVLRALYLTIQRCAVGDLVPAALMLRQWLDLPAPFTANHGHPIAREWRYFAGPKETICYHFYWEMSALEFTTEDQVDPYWEDKYLELAGPLTVEHGLLLHVLAMKAADHCAAGGKAWSVDFAQDSAGDWWMIDMALAESSVHPVTCTALRSWQDKAARGTCAKCGGILPLVMVDLEGKGFCGECVDWAERELDG